MKTLVVLAFVLIAGCAPAAEAPAAAAAAPASAVAEPTTTTPPVAPTEEEIAEYQARVGKGVAVAVSLATNAQAHEYASVLAAVTGELLATDPDACVRLLLPEQFGAASLDEFPASQRERFLTAQRAIFATAESAPTPAPLDAEGGPLYDTIAMQLEMQHGADAIAGLDGRNVPPATTCRAWHRLYSGVAAAPVDTGGRVMRWLNAP